MNVTAFKEAQEAYARGDYAKALQGFAVCTKELGDLSAADLSKFYHLIGNCYIKNGEPAKAAKYYSKAIENSSKSRRPALYVNLGTALLNSKDYENALKAFQSALKYPGYSTPYRAYSGIGAAQLKLGNTTEAGAAYREAALDQSNPMPAKALVNLGVCFMELGRPSDAIVSYETALDFDLDAVAAAKAKSNLGQAYMAEGRVQKAIDAFEEVIADGVYELTPIARHDYEIARKLKDRLDSKMPGILNTGFIPKVSVAVDEVDEPAMQVAEDPFAPASVDTTEEFTAQVADPTGTIDRPVADATAEPADASPQPASEEQDATTDEQAAQVQDAHEPEAAEPEAAEQGAHSLPSEDGGQDVAAGQPEGVDEDLSNAPTVAFAAVDEKDALEIDPGTELLGPQPNKLALNNQFDAADPSSTAAQAFAELDKEEDALPSPEDTAFFDVSETDINSAAKDEVRKERKRRGVGLKVGIVIGVICILVAAAACAAYFMGYGFPTQETVTENFVTAARTGEDTSNYWADNVDESTRANQSASLQGIMSTQVEAVERSMSQSVVYVKAELEEGGEVYYEVVLGRSGISWSVQYVELYFPSEQ